MFFSCRFRRIFLPFSLSLFFFFLSLLLPLLSLLSLSLFFFLFPLSLASKRGKKGTRRSRFPVPNRSQSHLSLEVMIFLFEMVQLRCEPLREVHLLFGCDLAAHCQHKHQILLHIDQSLLKLLQGGDFPVKRMQRAPLQKKSAAFIAFDKRQPREAKRQRTRRESKVKG